MPVTQMHNPATTRAAERYLEQYGEPMVMNTYLKITILVLASRLPHAGSPHVQVAASACRHEAHGDPDQ